MNLKKVGAAAAAAVLAALTAAPAPAEGAAPSGVLVIEMSGLSIEGLLSIPEVRVVASHGGAALLSHEEEFAQQSAEIQRAIEFGTGHSAWQLANLGHVSSDCSAPPIGCRGAELARAGRQIAELLRPYQDRTITVVVASISPSSSMRSQKDLVTGVALGTLEAIQGVPYSNIAKLPPLDSLHSLTSGSTRRDGVVVGSDLAATIGPTIGLTTGQGLPAGGYPIRITDEPAPFALHQRYLAQRRMYVPVGIAAGIYVAVVGLFGIAVVAFRRRLPSWTSGAAEALVLTAPGLFLALLEVGRLSTLDYTSAATFLVSLTILCAAAAFFAGRRFGPTGPITTMAAIVLSVLVVESVTGWPSALTPLLGGSALDGGRYYGMPNVEIGLMLAAAVFVAHRLPPLVGTALLIACGLLAGFPWSWAGANLGASITLLAAAGIWFGLRTTSKILSFRTVIATAAVTVAGTAIILITNRLSPGSPTHISNFLAGQGRTAGGILSKIGDRLAVGVHLIGRDPFALIPVVGVPLIVWFVLRPPSSVRASFEAFPFWREALLSVLLGSAVAYVVNDSGPAALGLGFGMALTALVYASLAVGGDAAREAVPEQRRARMMEST